MEITQMTRAHVAQIAALEEACFADPWSERSVASELENPLSLWLVALEDGAVAGYVGSQSVLGEADMMNLAVAPAYRRRGIARALLAALEQALDARQVGSLCLEVRAGNAPAIALYTACGYRQVGLRPGYYRHPREDALILKKQWRRSNEYSGD